MGSKSESGHGIEMIIGCGLLIFGLLKLHEKFEAWLALPGNKLKFIAICLALTSLLIILFWERASGMVKAMKLQHLILGWEEDSVYCGITDKSKEVWIKPGQRSMHTQVVGTTNAGKTESVIIPWAVQDIHSGKGLLLIDGKADNSLLDKLWAYAVSTGRQKDFKLFSLGKRENSFQFNPLLGGTAEEVTERVFNAFEFENPYYRSLQYEVMNQVMRVFESTGTAPTFQRLYQAISNPSVLVHLSRETKDLSLKHWVQWFEELPAKDRETRTSGLLTAIGHFAFGANADLFNTLENAITLDKALKENQIVYFQLPVLLSPFLGKATGKLVLQSLQAAVANRHRSDENKKYISIRALSLS